MTFAGLEISVFVTCVIQFLAEFLIGLVQEVSIADTYPVKGRFLGELDSKLLIEIVVNRRCYAIFRKNGSREKAHIIEHVRILLRDVKRVETSH